MSAHNTKKKRMGSRRRVVNQNETSKADEYHLTDSSSIPQHIPEENKEPLNVLANPHDSLSETQNPPSPELLKNRRKLGSSRRNKDSANKSYNKPREEVEEKIMGKETPETTQMSLAVQPLELHEKLGQGSEHGIMSATQSNSLFSAVAPDDSIEAPCKNCPVADLDGLIPKSEHLQADRDENDTDNIAMSESIVLGRNDKSDTFQSEELKAHPVGLSELSTLNVLSCPTVDQHQIDQLNSREMLEEELPNVYSVTKNESKESDKETELLHQDGNLQGNYLVSESQEKSVVIPFPTSPETTTDKSSPGENTELENSIEQEIISSPNKKLPKDEEQSEPHNLSEVEGTHHLEDAINNVHEQKVKEKENTKNTIKNSDITATLEGMHKTDTLHRQEEEGTPHSEDAVNRVPEREFETTQEISHSSDNVSHEATENYHVYDTKLLEINDTERPALGPVDEIKGQADGDLRPSAEQTGHQEKEGIFSEMEESQSSLQTLNSETIVPLEAQPLDSSVKTEDQTHTGFNLIENRRKLGSTRRKKGRQLVKESVAELYHEKKDEVTDIIGDNEALETMQMLVTIERTNQEELNQSSGNEHVGLVTQDSSLFPVIMSDNTSEVQSPTTPNYPKTDLESLFPKGENHQEDDKERETDSKVEVSDKSVGAALEEMYKTDTFQSQEVRDIHQSEDAVNKVHEQKVKATPEINHTSETVSHDTTENPEMISGNLIDQAEVGVSYLSELIVKSADDVTIKQEDSNPDGKFDKQSTKGNSFKALDPTNEDYLIFDSKQLETSGIERVDTSSVLVYEIEEDDLKPSAEQTGLFSEMRGTNSSKILRDGNLQDNYFVGESHLKSEDTESSIAPEISREKHSPEEHTKPECSVEQAVVSSPKEKLPLNEEQDEILNSSEIPCAHHLEDYVNSVYEQQVNSTQMHEISHSFEIVTHDATENSDIISGDLTDQFEVSVTFQSELTVKTSDDSTTQREDSNPDNKNDMHHVEENNFRALERTNEDHHVYDNRKPEVNDTETAETGYECDMEVQGDNDLKPSTDQTGYQEEEGIFFNSALQTSQSDMQAHLVHQPQPEDTNFKPIGDRRKLGSSRRHKGRQHAKDSFAESYHRPTEEVFGNTRDNTPESAVQVQEKSVETLQEGIDTIDTTHTKEVNDQVKENKHVGIHEDPPVGNSELSASSIHSSSTVDEQLIDQLHFTEMPEVELLNMYSVTEKESKNEGKDTELLRQDGNLQDNYLVSDLHLKSEDIESSLTQEISIEKISPGKHTDICDSIEQAALSSSPKKELSSNETSVKTLQECEEQTHRGFNPVGNRRKLGSSRRSKGRQLVKDCVTDPSQKPTEEFVENTKASDVLEQKDVCNIQKTDTPSCEKDLLVQEINMQQTSDATETVGEVTMETVGDVTVKDLNTEVKSSVDVQVFGQDEVGEKCEDPIKKDNKAQESNASQEVTDSELFSATHSTADALAQFDLQENLKVRLADADVPEESGISTAVGACDSQQGIQEKTLAGNSENLEKSKQRRRKMGSTRRTQLNRESEEGRDNDDENEGDFNMEAEIDFHKIEVAEAVADIKESEQNVGVNVEPLQLDGIHTTSELTERDATKTDITGGNFLSSFEITQGTQNDEERPESVNVIQGQALKSAEAPVVAVADLEIVKPIVDGGASEEHSDTQVSIQDPNNLNEGAHTENLEMKNASPKLYSARRKKMGSTRKSLSSRSKREDFHQKQEEDNEATEAITNDGDVKTESFPGIKEKEELQLHIETKEIDSEQRQEKIIETVEYSNIGESNFKPPSRQTFEENPVSPGHLVEMEQHLNPNYFPAVPSTSPKHDAMSETAGGRRRKLGSSRKSRGQQSNETQTGREDRITDTQNGRDDASVMDESAIKTTKEESLSLDKISEVDENDQKPSSNISIEHPRPVSERTPAQVTPVQQSRAETRLSQESQKTFSLGSSAGAAVRSNAYNVMMVGDSSVGKTSFMNRAQSGKFSLDLPASVGLDSCMWTVVVDGKPVVLQLWDTAGQERFHSITRQIFHKAQAFLLMYDITSSQSFAAVRYWLNCIQEGAAENVTIVLLGNKSDHAGRQVRTQDGENLAKDYGFEFMECSAATGENVINSLETVARMLSQKLDTREETSVLHKESQQKKSSGCC